MSVIHLPEKNCDHIALIKAISEAGMKDVQNDEIKIQFFPKTFLSTAALAQLCSWGLECRMNGCTFKFLGEPGSLSYASRINLFKHLGFEYAETFSRHDETGRFIPLCLLEDREHAIAAGVKAVTELVSMNIEGSESFIPALQWVVQEITDNVGNHSQSKSPGTLCAQLYPQKNRLDIAICDMGIGIKSTLAQHYPNLFSHGDAISKAIEAGVTRDLAVGQGNGLSGLQEIVLANGGDFHIWSGGTSFDYRNEDKKGFRVGKVFPGTGVCFSLRTNHPVDLATTTLMDRSERSLYSLSRVPKESDMTVVSIKGTCTHVGGRGPGKTLRDLLIQETRIEGPSPAPVLLQFDEADLASSSFLDEVFGRFAEAYGESNLEKYVHLTEASELVRGMIQKVVTQRLNEPSGRKTLGIFDGPTPSCKVLTRLCPFNSAVFVGVSDHKYVENWWSKVLKQGPGSLCDIHLKGNWPTVEKKIKDHLSERILMIPGWEKRIDFEPELVGGHESIAYALVHTIITFLKQDHTVYLLLPSSLLQSQRDYGLRKLLWEEDILRSVISLSAAQLGFADMIPGFMLTLLELGPFKSREKPRTVAMIDGVRLNEHPNPDKKILENIKKIMKPYGKDGEIGYRFTWLDPSDPIRYETHDPKLKTRENELADETGFTTIGDLLEFSSHGIRIDRRKKKKTGFEKPSPLLKIRDLNRMEEIQLKDLSKIQIPKNIPASAPAVGDVLVSSIWNGKKAPILGVLPSHLDGVQISGSFFILRFRNEADRDLVIDFLQSDFAKDWLKAHVSGLQIHLPKLLEMPVPAPGSQINDLVRKFADTSLALRKVADELDNQRRNILGLQSFSEQVSRYEETAMLATHLDQSLRSLSDLSERVRLLFPLPIALAWRTMEITERPRELYEEILRVFEATVGYLAVMLIADLRKESMNMEVVPRLLESFQTIERGPTLGDWVEVLRQSPRMHPNQAFESSGFPEYRMKLSEAKEKTIFWSTIKSLLKRRNDAAHKRGPQTEGEFKKESENAFVELYQLFAELSFLTRFRLTQVLSCSYDEIEEKRTVRIRELSGDHSVVPVQEVLKDREVGSGLYFLDYKGNLILGSPWINYAECPHCGHWEVTIPEFASKEDGETCYRSLQTGHIHSGQSGTSRKLKLFVGL